MFSRRSSFLKGLAALACAASPDIAERHGDAAMKTSACEPGADDFLEDTSSRERKYQQQSEWHPEGKLSRV